MRALLGDDLREAPVGIGAAQLVERHAREPSRLVQGRVHAPRQRMILQPRCRAEHPDPRPAPRDVDVVRERDGEPRSPVARRLHTELPAQPLERRVERIETRGSGEEASVPVVLGRTLLDPREVEEARRELVSVRQPAALDRLPRLGPVGHVVAETQTGGAHHVEHPARPLLDRSGDRHRASVVRERIGPPGSWLPSPS